jgi:hypothetical protein
LCSCVHGPRIKRRLAIGSLAGAAAFEVKFPVREGSPAVGKRWGSTRGSPTTGLIQELGPEVVGRAVHGAAARMTRKRRTVALRQGWGQANEVPWAKWDAARGWVGAVVAWSRGSAWGLRAAAEETAASALSCSAGNQGRRREGEEGGAQAGALLRGARRLGKVDRTARRGGAPSEARRCVAQANGR